MGESYTQLILIQDQMQVNWSMKKEERASSLGRNQESSSKELSEVSWDPGPCVNRMPSGSAVTRL